MRRNTQKAFDLRQNLKLEHINKDAEEIEKAQAAADDEFSFVKRSEPKFWWAIYVKTYDSDSTIADHAKKSHGIGWIDYQ